MKRAIIDVTKEINERKRRRRNRESANNQTDFVTRNVEQAENYAEDRAI